MDAERDMHVDSQAVMVMHVSFKEAEEWGQPTPTRSCPIQPPPQTPRPSSPPAPNTAPPSGSPPLRDVTNVLQHVRLGGQAIAGRPTTLASAAGAAQLARKRMLGLGTRRAMVVRRAGHQLRTTHAAGSPVLRRGAGSPAASGGGSGTGNPDKVVVAHMEATIKILELELQATKRLYHNAKTDAQVQREVLQRLLAEKVVVEEQLEEARLSASCARNTSIAQLRFELAEKHSEIDKILSDYTV